MRGEGMRADAGASRFDGVFCISICSFPPSSFLQVQAMQHRVKERKMMMKIIIPNPPIKEDRIITSGVERLLMVLFKSNLT